MADQLWLMTCIREEEEQLNEEINLALNIINKVLEPFISLIVDNRLFDVQLDRAVDMIHQSKHKDATNNFTQKQH